MNKMIFSFVVLWLTLASCKKDEALSSVRPEPVNPYKYEFVACNCQPQTKESDAPEYLKAEINGVLVCADKKGGFSESFDNMLINGKIVRQKDTTYYDNLHMIRYTSDSKFMMAIFLENSHALTKAYPYELPRSNPEFCEIGEFQLENQGKITPIMCSWCPDNNWHYYGQFFGNSLKLVVDKYENGFFEGRFSGIIKTGSGRTATVKNGAFRIKLTEIKRDIIIP